MTHFGFHLKPAAAAAAGTYPSFVNAGVLSSFGSSGTHTVTPALPASRVNGNILIAFAFFSSSDSTNITWSAGWTPGFQFNGFFAWAWRLVDGSETAPTATSNGTKTGVRQGHVLQCTGNIASPVGATLHPTAGSLPRTLAAMASTASYSMFLFCGMIFSSSDVVWGTPTGFSADIVHDAPTAASITWEMSYRNIQNSGSSNTAYNSGGSGGSAWWAFCIEIKSQ